MKKLIILILLIILNYQSGAPWAIINSSFAASPSPSPKLSPSPSLNPSQEKAKELKEKVASKIAELKILQKRAFLGTIKSLSEKGLVLTAQNKDITVETDTNTKITSLSKGVRKSLKLTDLTKGQKILVWGQFNKEAEILTAKAVFVRIFSFNLTGSVKSIEKNSLTILEKSDLPAGRQENQEYTIDISQAEIKSLKKDKTIAKIESKDISEGDFVHVYVTPKTEGDKTTYTAWRVLILPKSILEAFAKETPKPTSSPSITSSPKTTTP